MIVYSHGFGVKKDDRGLFTDIAASLPSEEHIMFDYNEVNEVNNTMVVRPLRDQAEILNRELAKYSDDITLICHSQGCVVAALATITNVSRLLFLTPPTHFISTQENIEKMRLRSETMVGEDLTVSYPRRDGSTTIIRADYWQGREDIDPIALYDTLARKVPLTIISANQDEVLGNNDFANLSERVVVIKLDGDHNFTAPARMTLLKQIQEYMSK